MKLVCWLETDKMLLRMVLKAVDDPRVILDITYVSNYFVAL